MNYVTTENVIKNRFKNREIPKWKFAIICFRDYSGSKVLVDLFKAKPIGENLLYGLKECEECPFVYEGEINGEKIIIVTKCLWGAPQAAILIEELIYFGVEYIIGYGAAGAINRRLKKGDQILAMDGLRTDGVSLIYNKASLTIKNELAEIAVRAAGNINIDLKKVSFATADALYRESDELINLWKSQGADAISMETSSFYAVINEHNKNGVWIGHISDCLFDQWDDWHFDREEISLNTAKICEEIITDLTKSQ